MRQQLADIISEFAESSREERLQLLLEYGNALPDVPERLQVAGSLEPVVECQTPFFLAVERDEAAPDALHLFFAAPREAPTTRGYAGVLYGGLEGATADEILTTPPDFFVGMRLSDVVSPLRLRGMSAILGQLKRSVANIG